MKINTESPEEKKILDFTEELVVKLKTFFAFFDCFFLEDEKCVELLALTKKSLEEHILKNESALAVIIAMGGDYDSGVDRAKVNKITALTDLINAKKVLKKQLSRKKKETDIKLRCLKDWGYIFKNAPGSGIQKMTRPAATERV